MRTTSAVRLAALVLAAGAVVSSTTTINAFAHGGDDTPAASATKLTERQAQVIRTATKHLQTVAAALAAGYVPAGDCTELPGVGGMGYHYLNPALASDSVVDPAHPEVLVFVPTRSGELKLGAAEYFVADADQDLSTDTDRPSLFGSYAFDGPMLGHEAGMPIHYDKHVWLYDYNPAGQLAPWNPRVSCATQVKH
jgi:hypothetical protein